RRSGHSDIAICCGRNVRGSSPCTSVVPLSNQVTTLNHKRFKGFKMFSDGHSAWRSSERRRRRARRLRPASARHRPRGRSRSRWSGAMRRAPTCKTTSTSSSRHRMARSGTAIWEPRAALTASTTSSRSCGRISRRATRRSPCGVSASPNSLSPTPWRGASADGTHCFTRSPSKRPRGSCMPALPAASTPKVNRPGGNVTGVTFLVTALGAKRLELLRELVPSAKLVGFLVNPANPTSEFQTTDTQAAARALGVGLVIRSAHSESDIDSAFESLSQQHVNAVIIGTDQLFTSRRDQLVALAARHALPAIYYLREFADAGGLISYGASITDAYRLTAGYIGRVLKGEKPAGLPVQQTVTFELAINAGTAKALGLTVPEKLLVAADELI